MQAAVAPRDERLDLIKAICITLVLCWHLEPIDVSAPHLQTLHFNTLLKESIIWFYFQLTLLAVPTFITVSLVLYFRKLAEHGDGYTGQRLVRLGKIFLAWTTIQYLVYYVIVIPKTSPILQQLAQLTQQINFDTFFTGGGPALPVVAGSVFYYLSMLIELTILAAFFSVAMRFPPLGLALGIGIVAASLLYFEWCTVRGISVAFTQLRTFVVYIPIAYYFAHDPRIYSRPLMTILFAGYLVFSIQDYFLRQRGITWNVYLRPSVICGAAALFYAIDHLRSWSSPRFVNFLSKYSLGIYAVHKYWRYLALVVLAPWFVAYGISKKVTYGLFHVNVQTLLTALAATTLTMLSILILRRTAFNSYLR